MIDNLPPALFDNLFAQNTLMRNRHRRSFHEPGHAHELTFSCYRRFPFLKTDRTCQWLSECIEEARQAHSFSLWAYVFLPDHVHLLIFPEEEAADMGQILKAIKAPVARKGIAYLAKNAPDWLPRITRRRGGWGHVVMNRR